MAANTTSPSTSEQQPPPEYGHLRDPKPEVSDTAAATLATATSADSQPSKLKELLQLCREEEEIRLETVRLDEEMERLKKEIQRAWFRLRELNQKKEDCQNKKKAILDLLHEKDCD